MDKLSGPALLVRLAHFRKAARKVPNPSLAHLRQCDREVIERYQRQLYDELIQERKDAKLARFNRLKLKIVDGGKSKHD